MSLSDQSPYSSPLNEIGDDQIREVLSLGLSDEAWTPLESMSGLFRKLATDPEAKWAKVVSTDLQSTVLAAAGGPLSFPRLAGVSANECQELKGHTFLTALVSSELSRNCLDGFVQFGELLLGESFPSITRLTGAAIRTLAQAALFERHGVPVDPLEQESFREVLSLIGSTPVLPQTLVVHAQRLLEHLPASSTQI